jgi:hypothetical protein
MSAAVPSTSGRMMQPAVRQRVPRSAAPSAAVSQLGRSRCAVKVLASSDFRLSKATSSARTVSVSVDPAQPTAGPSPVAVVVGGLVFLGAALAAFKKLKNRG